MSKRISKREKNKAERGGRGTSFVFVHFALTYTMNAQITQETTLMEWISEFWPNLWPELSRPKLKLSEIGVWTTVHFSECAPSLMCHHQKWRACSSKQKFTRTDINDYTCVSIYTAFSKHALCKLVSKASCSSAIEFSLLIHNRLSKPDAEPA